MPMVMFSHYWIVTKCRCDLLVTHSAPIMDVSQLVYISWYSNRVNQLGTSNRVSGKYLKA